MTHRPSSHRKPPSPDPLSLVLRAFEREEGQPDEFVLKAFDTKSGSLSLKAFDAEPSFRGDADKDKKAGRAPEVKSVLSAYVPPHMRGGEAMRSVAAKLPVGARAEMHGSMLVTVECGKSEVGDVGDLLWASGLQWQEE